MSTYRVEIDDRAVRAALDRLIRAATDTTPAMRAISETLADAAERAFDEKRDPTTNAAWAPWAPSTARRRAGGRLLQDTGRLAGSITARHDRDSAEAGTNVAYGVFHQLGTRKMPARPFLGLGPEEEDEILDILRRHLLPGAR